MPILHKVGCEALARSQNTHWDIVQTNLRVSQRDIQRERTAVGYDDLVAERRILCIASDSEGFFLETARSRGAGKNHSTLIRGANHARDAFEHLDARNTRADHTSIATA